ncbi:hypothetical protein [Paraburkholderia kururiensis]|jgi:hypothetical protein|uniref:hypothetical protein n=1 Tax=Paraburkholderia kururiensis TaxID=984307 RepID=UPI0018F4EE2C|nr:hypothetical protein [Paraburkholderia kururiensis]
MSEREYSAGIGDVKRLMGQRSGGPAGQRSHWTRLRWTPLTAVAALTASVFFTWAFLHAILIYVFPVSPVRH